MKTKKEHWLKKSYQKATLETKLLVVDQIQNGQISTNFASKKYDVPRTTISYWIKKYSTYDRTIRPLRKCNCRTH